MRNGIIQITRHGYFFRVIATLILVASIVVVARYGIYRVLADSSSGTANVFVSPSGNDSGGACKRYSTAVTYAVAVNDGSVCLSWNHAYSLAAPGDTIDLEAGSFGNQTIAQNTSNGKPGTSNIVIQPDVSANVTVGTVSVGLRGGPVAANYLTIDGQHRLTMAAYGVYLASGATPQASYDKLLNTHITSMTWVANALVTAMSADHFTLEGNEIGPSAPNSDGIDLTTGNTGEPVPSNISITDNNIHDLYDSCTEAPAYLGTCSGTGFGDSSGTCAGGTCNHVDGFQAYGCDTCDMERNTFYLQGNHKQGIFFDADVHNDTLQNLTIENNFIYNGDSDIALGIKDTSSNLGSGYMNIYYNTIVSDSGLAFYFENTDNGANTEWTPGSTFSMVGNIIHSGGQTKCSSSWEYSDGSLIPSANFIWSNNLLSGSACGSGDIGNSTPSFVEAKFPGAGTCGNSVFDGCATATGDPDLHLASLAGAAINAGESTYCPSIDIDSQSRPKGVACDLGADEYSNYAAGDINQDGSVDVFDLSILLSNWGDTNSPASDLNSNGVVDIYDLSILLSNYGT